MEKRTYVKPVLSGEEFIPQNYIAACGDSGTVYKFACNANAGTLYVESNGVDGLQREAFCNCGQGHQSEKQYVGIPMLGGHYETCNNWVQADDKLGNFNPCPVTHEASSTDVFVNGYIYSGGSSSNVIVWRGSNGREGHATSILDRDDWETAKS